MRKTGKSGLSHGTKDLYEKENYQSARRNEQEDDPVHCSCALYYVAFRVREAESCGRAHDLKRVVCSRYAKAYRSRLFTDTGGTFAYADGSGRAHGRRGFAYTDTGRHKRRHADTGSHKGADTDTDGTARNADDPADSGACNAYAYKSARNTYADPGSGNPVAYCSSGDSDTNINTDSAAAYGNICAEQACDNTAGWLRILFKERQDRTSAFQRLLLCCNG